MRYTMSSGAVVVGLLAVAGILVFVAERRRWRPPLWAALGVGLAFRVQLLLLTHMTKPYDIYHDYHFVGVSVLRHQDPLLHIRPMGWSYLPLYDFVLAGQVLLERDLHISWLYAGRSFSLIADLALIVLVGVVAGIVAGPETGALRRFQYACYPLAVIDSIGRMEATCLALALGAFALVLRRPTASTRRVLGAGALLGLAVGVNSWPVLFLPALWRALPTLRARLQATLGLGAVIGVLFVTMPLTVGTPVRDLPRDAHIMLTYHGTIGTWGWTSAVLQVFRLHSSSPVAMTIGTAGSVMTLAAVVAAVWWWRRAHPLDLASVTPCALLATTASFGGQYLMWPVATLLARPPKRAWLFHASVNAWSIIGMGAMALGGHLNHMVNQWWIFASLLVVPAIVVAMPWERRRDLPATERPGAAEPPDVAESAPGRPPLVLRPISDHPAAAPAPAE